jgi:hypothetical protein
MIPYCILLLIYDILLGIMLIVKRSIWIVEYYSLGLEESEGYSRRSDQILETRTINVDFEFDKDYFLGMKNRAYALFLFPNANGSL